MRGVRPSMVSLQAPASLETSPEEAAECPVPQRSFLGQTIWLGGWNGPSEQRPPGNKRQFLSSSLMRVLIPQPCSKHGRCGLFAIIFLNHLN